MIEKTIHKTNNVNVIPFAMVKLVASGEFQGGEKYGSEDKTLRWIGHLECGAVDSRKSWP